MSSKNPHKLSLTVQYASTEKSLPTRAQFRRWIQVALQQDVNITLRIVDEAEGRELNKNYRGKGYATNVLTFVYDDAPHILSGDIVICAQVVEHEAREQHKGLLAHYAHLSIHAVLHLQGYDHKNEKDAAVMEALESVIMVKLKHADPYQWTAS